MRLTPKPITLVDLLVSLNNTPAADGELVVDRVDGGDNDGDLHRAVDPVQLESPLRGQGRVIDAFCPLEAPYCLLNQNAILRTWRCVSRGDQLVRCDGTDREEEDKCPVPPASRSRVPSAPLRASWEQLGGMREAG